MQVHPLTAKTTSIINPMQLTVYQDMVFRTNFFKHRPKDILCLHERTSVSSILVDSNRNMTLGMKNVELNNITETHIPGYCFWKQQNNSMKYIIAPLGTIQDYAPDRYLTLHNVQLYLFKRYKQVSVTATGFHNLCGTVFNYSIKHHSKNVTIFEGHTNQSINMYVIELSHPLAMASFPSVIKEILTERFRVITSMIIHQPLWSIIWEGDINLSIFKGKAEVNVLDEEITNVDTELLIERNMYSVLIISMKIDFSKLIEVLFPLVYQFLPNLTDWTEEITVEKVMNEHTCLL